MNQIRIYFLALIVTIVGAYSCSKVKEIPVPLEPPLKFEHPPLQRIEAILSAANNLSIYKEIYKRSGVKTYMDSLRQAKRDTASPFTLFVPRDAAWQAKGYTLEIAKTLSDDSCSSLIKYLTVQGTYLPDSVATVSVSNTIFPIIAPRRVFYDYYGSGNIYDHFYSLNLGWWNDGVYLNGNYCGSIDGNVIPASDGAVNLIDVLPLKPEKSVYELLEADTSYSFYLTALRISNRVYEENLVGISPVNKLEEYFGIIPIPFYNYLSTMQDFRPNGFLSGESKMNASYFVFAPENNAFRKAGFADSAALDDYIRQSYITFDAYPENTGRRPMFTNMDSILNYCFFSKGQGAMSDIMYEYGSTVTNVYDQLIYISDMSWNSVLHNQGLRQATSLTFYDWTYFDENTWDFTQTYRSTGLINILFQTGNNTISIRRSDTPNGRTATIIPEHSNVTALNGVIHRLDNLLLPTP